MFVANEVFWFGALLLGAFLILASLRRRTVHQVESNNHVKVVTFRNGQCYKFACSTVRDAAAYALRRLATGEGVAYIEANGETIWNSLKGKQALVELAQ